MTLAASDKDQNPLCLTHEPSTASDYNDESDIPNDEDHNSRLHVSSLENDSDMGTPQHVKSLAQRNRLVCFATLFSLPLTMPLTNFSLFPSFAGFSHPSRPSLSPLDTQASTSCHIDTHAQKLNEKASVDPFPPT